MKVSTLQYAKTLLELTDNKSQEDVLDVVKKFAEALKKDGQLKNSGKIMENFSELYDKQHGVVEANVVSSRSLSSDQVSQIESFIKDKYGANTVEIRNTVDEKIKGGIVIKVADEVIDASILNQLKRLHKKLAS